MDSINNLIEFHTKKETETELEQQVNPTEDMVAYPTAEEIYIVNSLIEQYADNNPGQMIPFNMWNGDCYKTLFKEMSTYAKEIQADPWDVFALFINKIHGLKIERDDNGGVIVKYGKD